MIENTMQTNRSYQTVPTDSTQAVQQPPEDQAGLSDSQVQLSQASSSTKRTAPGRMPLFRK